MPITFNNVSLTSNDVSSANVSFSYCHGRKIIIAKDGETPIKVSLRKLMKAVNNSNSLSNEELQELLDAFEKLKNKGYQKDDPELKGKPFLRFYMRLIRSSKKTHNKQFSRLKSKIAKPAEPLSKSSKHTSVQDPVEFEQTLKDWQRRKEELEANPTETLYDDRCKLRAEIYQETRKAAKQGFFVDGEFYQLDPEFTASMLEGTKLYSGAPDISGIINPNYETEYDVLNEDTFVVGKAQLDAGYYPVVLNLANAFGPGGGVIDGHGAQEESLCRDSNYHDALLHVKNQKREGSNQKVYPINGIIGEAVYTPHIQVFRGKESDGFPFIKPFEIAAIACAAIDFRSYNPPEAKKAYQDTFLNHYWQHPEIEDKSADKKRQKEIWKSICKDPNVKNEAQEALEKERSGADYEKETKAKIRVILATAIAEGHDSIVLGSFGCGVFLNDPVHVARLFKETLDEFEGYFRKVDFAILEFSDKDTAASLEFKNYFKT